MEVSGFGFLVLEMANGRLTGERKRFLGLIETVFSGGDKFPYASCLNKAMQRPRDARRVVVRAPIARPSEETFGRIFAGPGGEIGCGEAGRVAKELVGL